MRIKAPQEQFERVFASPDGPYTILYGPVDEWDGQITMTIRSVKVEGAVPRVEQEPDGGRVLMGMTAGFHELYQDEFWFILRPDSTAATIEYWGNQILWRRDVTA
jgi:hypothetical protein